MVPALPLALALALAAPTGPGGPAARPDRLAQAPGAAAAAPEPREEDAPVTPAAPSYLVERIEFSGLRQVKAWAARRHVVVAEGRPLDEERVLASRLRLLQVGWFSAVETRLARGSARGLVVLVFEVVERNTLVVTDLVAGSTGPQPFYAGLGLAQQNFLGEGLSLGGSLAYGGAPSGRPTDPARFALRGGFDAPDVGLWGRRLTLGATGLWLRGEELTCADAGCDAHRGHFGDAPRLRYQRAGGALDLGLRVGPFERLGAGLRFERVSSQGVPGSGGVEGPVPVILPGRSRLAALTGQWSFDSRDDLFLPTDGVAASAQVTFSSRLLGSQYEYSRYVLQLETGFGLLGRPLRFQGQLGAAQGGAPFFERFYAADLAYFAVGPALGRAMDLNFSTDSRYDAFAAMAGLEYAVPLWRHGAFLQRGYLALGARAVWSSAELGGTRTRFSRWPVSLDAALRLDTPVGTFNLSIGAVVDNAL